MLKSLFIIIFFLNSVCTAQEFKLICSENTTSNSKDLTTSFSKIIDFENQTLQNYSGSYFDDVVLFGRDEIIIQNYIFQTTSTFNINTNKWTTYKDSFVKIYSCVKKKRRLE
jgi:hypothetical protein